ncbi:MAG: hypothetical protein SGI77_12655 [Pirellulaceae bacterium]|nr:hypothetical protein [Pirellulaceae bacterium]
MHTYRVLETSGNKVLAQSLDRVEPIWLDLGGRTKLVENEVVVVETVGSDSKPSPTETPIQCVLMASRVDPNYIGGPAPQLISHGDDDSEFVESLDSSGHDRFDVALEWMECGESTKASKAIRALLKQFPYHIDLYHHLGLIEQRLNRRDRALKYFEMGYRIGLLSLPKDFSEKLRWGFLKNRPFLRAAHGYGLALEGKGRVLEAAEVYQRILSLNPDDNQGIRYLLPSLYIAAKATYKARSILQDNYVDSMNVFSRSLLEILDGYYLEALRWFCRGLAYNIHFPSVALADIDRTPNDSRVGVSMGSPDEVSEYLAYNKTWRIASAQGFLRRAIQCKPIAERIAKALSLDTQLAERNNPDISDRSTLIDERYAIFNDKDIAAFMPELRECFLTFLS